ncbi:hypothetical protein ACQU0X_26630 [Pseudovibrio ascidiaceicola]|uniref:hypothetical protein n=1 Tax=Pseudovibrio ascidiaceicola TaxID=285279 RepID=UPI003D36FF91
MFDVYWRSQKGDRVPENRDFGGAGIRLDTALYVIADGSTSRQYSGELAQSLVHHLVDWFVESNVEFTAKALIEQLRKAHTSLSKVFSASSASYAILHLDQAQYSQLIHAGDCLIGRSSGCSPIQWQIKPHTLANAMDDLPIAEIAKKNVRNRLTRSFRAKEFLAPSIKAIQAEDTSFILATDGFWADLSEKEQAAFATGQKVEITSDSDDKSILCIGEFGPNSKECLFPEDNFYLKKHP